MSLHHLQLAMPADEEDTARSFYGELLGLDEIPKPEHLAKRGGCWFKGPELELHLGVEADFRPARKAHPAFSVRGLHALRENLKRAGIEIVEARNSTVTSASTRSTPSATVSSSSSEQADVAFNRDDREAYTDAKAAFVKRWSEPGAGPE